MMKSLKKTIRKLCFLFLSSLLFLSSYASVSATAQQDITAFSQEQMNLQNTSNPQNFSISHMSSSKETSQASRKIRVAYPVQSRLTDVDEDGNLYGYTYEYLQEIAQYTGWDYEFVQMDGTLDEVLETMMEMVQNGEIDLMSGMLYTGTTSNDYSYSSLSYGTKETVLQTTSDNMSRVLINSQVEQTLRIAVLRTTGRSIEELEDYCHMNMITPEYIICKEDKEMVTAIEEGRADALLNSNMNYLPGVRTFARFAPKPFYFVCSTNDDSGLMNELNMALLSIEQSNPYFSTQLYEKYFEPQNYNLHITEEEQSYIENRGVIRLGILSGQAPFQYLQKDGTYTGITIDLLANISEKTGLEFELISADSYDKLFQMTEEGQFDLIAGITYDYDFAGSHNMVMTQPYLSTQYMLVMNEETSRTGKEGKRLALPVTTLYDGYTVGNVIHMATRNDCIQAVRSGEADYTYVDAYTAQYYINQPDYWGLKMVPLASETLSICFGIPKPADRQLLLLINKVINDITIEEIQTITSENTFRNQKLSYIDLARLHPAETIIAITSILLLFFLLFALLLFQRTRHNRKAAIELKKRFRVCSLTNDYFFEYDIIKQTLDVSIPSVTSNDGIELKRFGITELGPTIKDSNGEEIPSFGELLRRHESGSWECYERFPDESYHWMRVALEPIYVNGIPSCIVGKINLIDNEKLEKEKLTTQAQLDGLTGIYNSRTCHEKIEEALSALQPGEKGALILFDIDHFKSINDTFGHMQGDIVLKQLSSALKNNIHHSDIFGRFGGDEFILYLFNITDKQLLEHRCNLLRQILSQSCHEECVPFTVSMGAIITSFGQNYSELLQAADGALYTAKRHGRNCFFIAEDISGTTAKP